MNVPITKTIIIFFFFPLVLLGQINEADTSASPFAKPDTLKTQPVRSQLYWYNLDQELKVRGERDQYDLYESGSEIGLIYTSLSDVFRTKPLWFTYNLFESDRPSYTASINKLPHQTSFYYDGVIVNDLIHGMYNLQFVPVMFAHRVQGASAGSAMRNFGMGGTGAVGIISNSLHTKAPYTRVLYKEGIYGYSDIDISFVQPVTENFAVQLGGINKVYDGTILNTDNQGTNYRGEFTWQYNPRLYLRGQFFINRQRTGMTSYDPTDAILFPRYIEWRDDYFIDVTWQPHDSTENRLHAVLWNTYTFRRLKDRLLPAYVIKNHAKQYGIDVNYRFYGRKLDIVGGIGLQDAEIHGTAFREEYHPRRAQLYYDLKYSISPGTQLKGAAQAIFHKEFDPQIAVNTGIHLLLSRQQIVQINAERSIRIPTTAELYFNYDSLYGNQKLVPEEFISVYADYTYYDSTTWQFHIGGGYNVVKNEIRWVVPMFINDQSSRSFSFTDVSVSFALWKFRISAGGQYTFADLNLSPRSSVWGKIHYHDVWLKGAVIIDAYGAAYAYDKHRTINFESRLDRFFLGSGEADPFYTLSWKVVTTVKEAQLFFEMDNPLSDYYYFVEGYPEQFIRWRFGINWVLWD